MILDVCERSLLFAVLLNLPEKIVESLRRVEEAYQVTFELRNFELIVWDNDNFNPSTQFQG